MSHYALKNTYISTKKNERKLIVTCSRMTATFNFAYYLKFSTVTIWNSSDRESAWSNCIETTSKLCRPICSKKCSLKNHNLNVDESDYKPINTMHISPLCKQSLYWLNVSCWLGTTYLIAILTLGTKTLQCNIP